MKKLIFSLVVILLLPLGIFSQTKVSNNCDYLLGKKALIPFIGNALPLNLNSIKGNDESLALTYTVVDTVNGAFASYTENTSPFLFDPASNNLILIRNYNVVWTSGGPLYLYLYLHTVDISKATDTSKWTKRLLYSSSQTNYQTEQTLVDVPSIAYYNNGKTDPTKYQYLVYSILNDHNFSTNTTSIKAQFSIVDGISSTITNVPLVGPNNNYNFSWSSKMKSLSYNNNNYLYQYGSLSPTIGYYSGQYDLGIFNADFSDYNLLLPTEWDPTKFRVWSSFTGPVSSTFSSALNMDCDNSGNLYAEFYNYLKSDSLDRVPCISKSTDYGYTWSSFGTNPMPISVLQDYIASQGGISQDNGFQDMLPYSSTDFIVTGTDQYSFIFRVLVVLTDSAVTGGSIPLTCQNQLVEAYYNSGSWGMRKIANLNVVVPYNDTNHNSWLITDTQDTHYAFQISPYLVFQVDTNAVTDFNAKDTLYQSPRENEIQVAKTADGKTLIVKWVDFSKNIGFATPDTLWFQDHVMDFDSLPTTDVFCSYRNLTDNTWTNPQNVTNDDKFNKNTFIPPVVPSLTNIPMISLQSFSFTSTGYYGYRSAYPDILVQMCGDSWQTVRYSKFSLGAIDVPSETPHYDFNLSDIRPNPVSGFTEITFSLDKNANCQIDLYNALGQKVSTLLNGFQSAGIHGINVNTDNLVDGIYYYTLTVDGNSLTKIMSVAK